MKRLVQAVVSLLLLAAAGYFLDWSELAQAVKRVRPSTIGWALLATQASFACAAVRWLWLVKEAAPAPASSHLITYYRSVFFNFFSPGSLAGDAYRVVALRGRAGGLGVMVVAVLKERVLGVISFCIGMLVLAGILGAGSMPLAAPVSNYLWTSTTVAATVLAGIAIAPRLLNLVRISPLVRIPGAQVMIDGLRDAVAFGGVKSFSILMATSLAALVCWYAVVGRLAIDLNVGLSLVLVGTIMIITELIRLIPTSFQGIGVREGTFAVLFGLSGGNPEDGFILGAVAYLVLSLSMVVAGGLALAFDLCSNRKSMEAAENSTSPGSEGKGHG
ncbi:MAG: flippase-like domain-containing protein [Rhodospirillales bacterium]|nr:flippase-like domain-containing protein [Rhodospirillales bacterium]